MSTNAKVSENPLHAILPQVFKRNGEVRRLSTASRFSKQLVMHADRAAPDLMRTKSITIETPFGLMVLNESVTKMIQEEDAIFRAMFYNGWSVYPTPIALEDMLPETLVQTSFAVGG